MSEILVRFKCGHIRLVHGNEDGLRCGCGESVVERIEAPMPRFTGHCRGPHAEYQALEAKPVKFGEPVTMREGPHIVDGVKNDG